MIIILIIYLRNGHQSLPDISNTSMKGNSKKYFLQGSAIKKNLKLHYKFWKKNVKMIYSPSSTTRLIQIVHGSLGHISQTTEQSSFTFGFTFQTHQIRNNIQISIIYIFFVILDLVVLDISFGYPPWFIRIFCKLFKKYYFNNF